MKNKAYYKPLTVKEMEIMKRLWTAEEMTARELSERFEDPKLSPNAVSAFLRVLEEKGWISHRAVGPTNLYKAEYKEEEMDRKTIKNFISQFFKGSAAAMISTLLKNEEFSREELRELKELVNKKEEGK